MMYIVRDLCPCRSGGEYLFTYKEYAIEFAKNIAMNCIDEYKLDLDKGEVESELELWGYYPEPCSVEEIRIVDKYRPAP